MWRAPAGERRQSQPPLNDAIAVLEQQHFGEQILVTAAVLQLAHRLVADREQILARQPVFVLIDALENELLVFLAQWWPGPGRAMRRGGAPVGERVYHGSTCTVTSARFKSCLSRASTWSAIACAAATLAEPSTAIVTSA